ncbi:RTA1-domain protein [Rhizoctonia solani AG-3 Rhs1AP]|uniref:RTA1-domain protein n=2 Tax=Rhizoctonia solani AG-3 TaxID=1086053 RepID=A0A074RZP9_9AGAM|nr:RTA1-domain protein [Rhizoctonia solani AG-3 Rhs1AP]KEP50735.1 RTA1-domain protein [Rhizoctonia solani 123E]
MSRLGLLVLVSTWCSLVGAQNTTDTPTEKVGGHLGYIPNTGAAVIFFLLYFSVAAHGTWLMFRHKGRYMTALVVCGYIYAFGLILRIGTLFAVPLGRLLIGSLAYGKNYSSLGLYVFLNLCTVLSPCGFIATVYVLLGRLSQHLYAEEYLLIRPNWITKIYVTSDVVTLLIQAAGGGMASTNDVDRAKLAGRIFLAGLILQLISFASYIFVFGMFVYWMKTERVVQWNEARTRSWGQHWKGLVYAVIVSCLGITIRCIYRTIEGAQGFSGYLLTHEAYFYILDVLPLLCAVIVYNYVWPPAVLVEAKNVPGPGVEMGRNRIHQQV